MEGVMTIPSAGGNIKSLKLFSKKLGETIDILAEDGRLVPKIAKYWADQGWNNYGGSWLDKGWNNYSGSWMDKGWNNYSGSWMDKGWNNYGSSWTDSGWSNTGGGGGCYITTAAIEHMGLEDHCEQLDLLRKYRDKLAEEDEQFKKIVLEYYKTAPQIVDAITNSEEKEEVLDYIYHNMVTRVLDLLKENKIDEAKALYLETYKKLKAKYYKIEPKKTLVKK